MRTTRDTKDTKNLRECGTEVTVARRLLCGRPASSRAAFLECRQIFDDVHQVVGRHPFLQVGRHQRDRLLFDLFDIRDRVRVREGVGPFDGDRLRRAIDQEAGDHVAVGQHDRIRLEVMADGRTREEDRFVSASRLSFAPISERFGPTSLPSPLTRWHFTQVPFVAENGRPLCCVAQPPWQAAASAAAAWRRRPPSADRVCRPGCGCLRRPTRGARPTPSRGARVRACRPPPWRELALRRSSCDTSARKASCRSFERPRRIIEDRRQQAVRLAESGHSPARGSCR